MPPPRPAIRFDDTFLRALDALVILARRLQSSRHQGERLSPRAGASLEFRDYREYSPGDDLRSVDWNVFARHGQLHVKQFSAERDLHAHIAVDVSASMGFYGKRNHALSVAAALGAIALSRGDTLSWSAFSAERQGGAIGLRGRGRLMEYLRGLEAAPVGGRTRLAAATPAPGAGLVVLISDFADPAAREAIRVLRPRSGDLVAIHVEAEEDLNPPFSGRLRLADSESGAEADIDVDEGTLRRYRAFVDARRETLRAACAAAATPWIRVRADAPLRDLVVTLLRPGGALARR